MNDEKSQLPNPAGPMVQGSTGGQLEPGFVLDGRYKIESFLGKGGMCSVFKAKHLLMDKYVAIKLLHPNLVIDADAIKRFQREAVTVSTVEHPNIVKAYGFGMFGMRPYIAMEFLHGQSLADLLKQDGKLSKELAIKLLCQICDGLAHAHSSGVIHRDLKPSNIMLAGPEQQVKIVDFGIAKILPESGKELQKLTQTGEIFGTLRYMSPEQCLAGTIDARSDIYAVGCTMYEVLTGSPPFTADAPYQIMAQQMQAQPEDHECLGGLASVVFQCLEKQPLNRPQTAEELKTLILNPPQRKRKSSVKIHSQWPPKKLFPIVITGVLSALAVAGSWWHFSPPSADTQTESQKIAEYRRQAKRLIDDADTEKKRQHAEVAAEFYEQAIQSAKAADDFVLRLTAQAGLAQCLSHQPPNNAVAPEFLPLIIATRDELEHRQMWESGMYGDVRQMLGTYYADSKQPAKALPEHEAWLHWSVIHNKTVGVAAGYVGLDLQNLNRPEAAIAKLQQAVDELRKTDGADAESYVDRANTALATCYISIAHRDGDDINPKHANDFDECYKRGLKMLKALAAPPASETESAKSLRKVAREQLEKCDNAKFFKECSGNWRKGQQTIDEEEQHL